MMNVTASITASMIKELRERTGGGMMECKKALQETNGDIQAAIDLMRKRGQAKAAKRAGKIAAEGTVVIEINADRNKAMMIEVNCETDFVVRGDHFKKFAEVIAKRGLQTNVGDVTELAGKTLAEGGNDTIEHARQELILKIGENIQLRRLASLESAGIVGFYRHGDRIGVLVAIDKDEPELAKDLAMHIAASNPLALDESDMPESVVAKEREIFTAQAKESGKSDDIIEKMVAGRLSKFMKESCLVSQPFVKDADQTVASLLQSRQAKVTGFVRFEVGEGIEKRVEDFAQEVKAQVQGS